MTTETLTLDEVFDLATRLAAADRKQLVARLIVQDTFEIDMQTRRERRRRYYEEAAAYGPVSPTAAEILDADRRERDAILMGVSANNVHD